MNATMSEIIVLFDKLQKRQQNIKQYFKRIIKIYYFPTSVNFAIVQQ